MPGTIITRYDTVRSPDAFPEVNGTQTQLISTIGMLTTRKGAVMKDNYILQVDLTSIVKFEDNKYVVVDYQVDEYGIGDSRQEAERDLFDSLVDFLASLERRENRLGDRERHHLQILRNILRK